MLCAQKKEHANGEWRKRMRNEKWDTNLHLNIAEFGVILNFFRPMFLHKHTRKRIGDIIRLQSPNELQFIITKSHFIYLNIHIFIFKQSLVLAFIYLFHSPLLTASSTIRILECRRKRRSSGKMSRTEECLPWNLLISTEVR